MSSPASVAANTIKLLPALQHATSGSLGTLISTCALYPLSLAITRLQLQDQLQHGRPPTEGRGAGATARQSATGHSDGHARPKEAAYAVNATTGATANATVAAAATATSHHPGYPHQDGRNPPNTPSDYAGIADAFSKIYATEGGLKALYTGLGTDAVKSLLDSFLFFMFYEWFRNIRVAASYKRKHGQGGLGALEQLAVGIAAGVCSRTLTTPIANVAARKQTARMVAGAEGRDISEITRRIKDEKGSGGLLAGFSANLVLALNPSITFFLQEFLQRKVVSRGKPGSPGLVKTFLVAATSKAIASAVTYPFQSAHARLQTGIAAWADEEEDLIMLEDRDVDREVESKLKAARAMRKAARRSLFGTLVHVVRTEGVGSLYAGLRGEMLKGFLGHGATMVAKDAVHRLLFKLYLVAAAMLGEYRLRRGGDRARAAAAATTTTTTARDVAEPTATSEMAMAIENAMSIERSAPVEQVIAAAVEAPRPAEQPRFLEPPPPPTRAIEREPQQHHSVPVGPAARSMEPVPMPASPTGSERPPSMSMSMGHDRSMEHPLAQEMPRKRPEAREAPVERERGSIMNALPPALQYRIATIGSSKRRPGPPRSRLIVNMFDKTHREFE